MSAFEMLVISMFEKRSCKPCYFYVSKPMLEGLLFLCFRLGRFGNLKQVIQGTLITRTGHSRARSFRQDIQTFLIQDIVITKHKLMQDIPRQAVLVDTGYSS